MTCIAARCLHCPSEQIVKRGKTRRSTQRYLCQNTTCTTGSFLPDYRNRGCLPEVKQTIVDMSLNASGIRDTARVLQINTDTVLSELKKKEAVLESVNTAYCLKTTWTTTNSTFVFVLSFRAHCGGNIVCLESTTASENVLP